MSQATTTAPATGHDTVAVWDLPTRLFHWALVVAILSTWPSFEFSEQVGDTTMAWHRYNGYAILVLLVFRVIWGFAGSSTARWSNFVTWPWHAAGYALDMVRGRDRKFLGHNPLGTYMVLALLLAVAGQALLGLFVNEHNDVTWGPLAKFVSEDDAQKSVRHWHVAGFFWVILPLAAAHFLANAVYGLVKNDPLIRAMVTGRKPAAEYEDATQAHIDANVMLRALISLIIAVAIVLGGIKVFAGAVFY